MECAIFGVNTLSGNRFIMSATDIPDEMRAYQMKIDKPADDDPDLPRPQRWCVHGISEHKLCIVCPVWRRLWDY